MRRKRSPLTIARLGQLDTLVADRPRILSAPFPLRIRVQLPAETLRSLAAAAATGTLAEVDIPHGEIPWTSDPIMLTDTPTGDGRTFLSTGADHGPLPLPLMANLSTTWGHDGAENCGRIETIEFDHPRVRATGFFADTDFARDVVRAVVAKNVRGISVDLRDVDGEVEIIEDDGGYILSTEFTATRWKIDGATVTPFPAFDDAEIFATLPSASVEEPVDGEAMSLAMNTLEVIGDPDLPFADREQEWDSTAAETSVREYASSDGSGDEATIDWDTYSRAFFYRDPEADAETFGAYSLGFAEFADGELRAVPRGIFAVAAVLQGSRGGTDIPQEDQDRLKERVGAYYARMADEFEDPTLVPPWSEESGSVEGSDQASNARTALDAEASKTALTRHGAKPANASGTPSIRSDQGSERSSSSRVDATKRSGTKNTRNGLAASTTSDSDTGSPRPTSMLFGLLRKGSARSVDADWQISPPASSTSTTITPRDVCGVCSASGATSPSDISKMIACGRCGRLSISDADGRTWVARRWDTEASDDAASKPTALVAAARRRVVAASFFEDPGFAGEIVPPTLDDHSGRYFGHLALWDECHAGYVDACFLAPHSETDYAYFLTGSRRTSRGEVPVGHVTLGTGHAHEDLDWRQAMGHYDNTGFCAADIAVGEDERGIWFSGQPVKSITDDQLERLMAHALSGDWRWVGGNLEMIAVLAVNVPGYVVPRVKASVRNDRVFSLVASGARRLEALHQLSRKPVSTSEYLALKAQVDRLMRADARRRIEQGCR